jgi:hypothetical protein
MPKLVKIKFQNGINGDIAHREILNELAGDFIFEESDQPDFILFGPYGNDIPVPGNYTRIGYFCENIKPDLSICEWAFGVPREEVVKSPRYKRIQWHGLDPQVLIKPAGYDAEKILDSKTSFCNFLYSHKVPYREAFFSQLSKYKKVDAPGKSMNNMPGIDTLYKGGKWEVKRAFLSGYKFTIAFENDVYPGYQTEKLYDAMMADSIPVYCGDPFIGDIFNTKSFINVHEYLPQKNGAFLKQLESAGQMDFADIRPMYLKGPGNRIKRKVKSLVRAAKINLQFAKADFSKVIEQIIAMDTQPDLYLKYLEQPWFNNNIIPENSSLKKRWIEIFNS